MTKILFIVRISLTTWRPKFWPIFNEFDIKGPPYTMYDFADVPRNLNSCTVLTNGVCKNA